jgi:hypothetical protein
MMTAIGKHFNVHIYMDNDGVEADDELYGDYYA